MKQNKEKILNVLATSIILCAIFFFGFHLGINKNMGVDKSIVTASLEDENLEVDMASFWKVWQTIDQKYPEASEIDSQKRVESAISGLMSSLDDPYSVYLNEEETKFFKEEIRGSFSGVGMEIGIKDDILTVIAPLKDTPAYRAGIKAGDRVVQVDEKSTKGMTTEEAVKIIRGEKGTPVMLHIAREGETKILEIEVIRDVIQIPTLDTELRQDGIFVINLYSFSGNSTKLFKNAMQEFVNSGSEKLILDLRGNPGGYLQAAVDISSWFLPKGRVVVVESYGEEDKEKKYRSEGYDIFGEGLKFVILIDAGSASASEIVAGALQDYEIAKLVGTQSFGKGSVQELVQITKNTIVKITTAKWLTPNGTSISETGLTPDYEVEMTKEDLEKNRDPQMLRAVNILNNWYKHF